MPEELNNNITNSEKQGEQESIPTPQKTEQVSDYTAPTESEFKKAIQSASSKAKFEILQELGIKNVEEFRNLRTTYDAAISETESLKKDLNTSKENYSKLKEDLLIVKSGVAEEFKDDFLTLVKSKAKDENDFDTIANEILTKNPNWRKGIEIPKIGTEKSESITDKQEPSSFLKKKYVWLK